MVGHLVSCLIWLARRNRPIDRFMLTESSLRAPRLGKQSSAHPFKMGADRVKHFANPREAQTLSHLAVESVVEFMEALKVSACDGRPLISEILTETLDSAIRHIRCTNRDNFHLERAAHQHALPHIFEADLGDVRAALRLDHDKTFECEPIDRSRYGKPRHFENGAPLVLVDRSLGSECAGYDGLLKRKIGLIDFRPSGSARLRCGDRSAQPVARMHHVISRLISHFQCAKEGLTSGA